MALGSVRRDSWQWDAAADQYLRALELEPDNVEARHQYAEYLFGVGRIAEGLENAEHARSLDPLSGIRFAIVAGGRWLDDDCERAIEAGELALERTPSLRVVEVIIVGCYFNLGDLEASSDAVNRFWSESRQDSLNELALQRAVQARDASLLPEGEWSAGLPADVWLAMGDTATALDQVERASFNPPYLVPYYMWNPSVDGLRGYPRFESLIKRLNLEGREPLRTER